MKRPRQRSFLSFEKAASEAMPPVPPQMFPRISTISPIGGERSNAADAQAVHRQTTVTRAPRSRARLQHEPTRRRLMAKPCTPHLHCAARAALQAQNLQCRGSRGTPLAFLLGFQRGDSLWKENPPFDCALPCQWEPPFSAFALKKHDVTSKLHANATHVNPSLLERQTSLR